MERRSVALLFLFFLCFPLASDSEKLNPSTSILNQEQAHEVTTKDTKGGGEDKSIYIFRAGKGAHAVTGGRGGGRKAFPKRNTAMDLRPPMFFSAASVLFTGFTMFFINFFRHAIK